MGFDGWSVRRRSTHSLSVLSLMPKADAGKAATPTPPPVSRMTFTQSLERDFTGARFGWLGDFGGSLAFDANVLELCKSVCRQNPWTSCGCPLVGRTSRLMVALRSNML